MVKGIFAFLVVFALIYGGVFVWSLLKKDQRWSIVKTATYSFAIAVVAFLFLVGIVILF